MRRRWVRALIQFSLNVGTMKVVYVYTWELERVFCFSPNYSPRLNGSVRKLARSIAMFSTIGRVLFRMMRKWAVRAWNRTLTWRVCKTLPVFSLCTSMMTACSHWECNYENSIYHKDVSSSESQGHCGWQTANYQRFILVDWKTGNLVYPRWGNDRYHVEDGWIASP